MDYPYRPISPKIVHYWGVRTPNRFQFFLTFLYKEATNSCVTRLTWVVGQAGLWQGLLVITLCNVVTVLSALSMSAISTNGKIAAGGVYYMISRALGPAIGGSIGLMFTIANTISVGTYTVGFATSVSDLLQV